MSNDQRNELSLAPVATELHPGKKYSSAVRIWQGIPGIERTTRGRLYATWYSGGADEGWENYVLLVSSDDDGMTWPCPLLAIDPPGRVRAFDPVLWIDPRGRLWLFWAQSYDKYDGRAGVWCIRCDEPDAPAPAWTSPRRIAHGIMMNKPLVRANGEWLLPVAVWDIDPKLPELARERKSNLLVSIDEGASFLLRGGADVPGRNFDEHMVVERRDGSLWLLVRTEYGIGQSSSRDGGATWEPGAPTDIAGPSSRFFLRRLASGRLLLINHFRFTKRSHLTASLSEDDGTSWTSHLLLDERADVSYPDATISADGRIRVIYDRERKGAREILMASFLEEEIVAGALSHSASFLKRIVDKVPA
jgi:predicted neuraminidase